MTTDVVTTRGVTGGEAMSTPMNEPGPGVAQVYLQSIVDTVREPFLVLDKDLRIVSANRSFYHTFHLSHQETEGQRLFALGSGQWDIPLLRRLLNEILLHSTELQDFEVDHTFPGIGRRAMLLNARRLYLPGDDAEMILLGIEDVTTRREAEAWLHRAYERERRITDALQRPLTTEIAEDAFPGLSVATLYKAGAADEARAGGDFFDIFALPQNRVALYVGDVSGKGLAAAARCAQVKDVLRAFVREHPLHPGHALSRLNEFLCGTKALDDAGEETFFTLALVVLDPATGTATASCAGAEAPLVVRADGRAEAIAMEGSLLGMFSDQRYAERTLHFEAGDTLVLVTDGITEAHAPKTKAHCGPSFLGYNGMQEMARQAHTAALSPRRMGQVILEGARAFAGGSLHDDACLLLARRR